MCDLMSLFLKALLIRSVLYLIIESAVSRMCGSHAFLQQPLTIFLAVF